MRHVFRVFLGIGVVLCLAPRPSLAQTNNKAEAHRHHDLGLSCMKKKAYGEAIAEFNQAYDLGHDVAVLYDIGQAYVAMDQPVFAVKTLKKFLAEGGKQVPTVRRKEAEATVAIQQRRIASVTIHAAVDGLVLRVDGIAVGKTPLPAPLELKAGAHFLSASVEGYRPWDQPLDLAGGEKRDLEIRLDRVEAAQAPPTAAAVPVTPEPAPVVPTAETVPSPEPTRLTESTAAPPSPSVSTAPPTRKIVAYALGGVGVAALAVGGVYGVTAISKRHDSNSNCPQNQCTQAGVDLNNQAKTAARVADISIGVGLVTVAVATYLLLRPVAPSSPTTSPAAPAVQVAAALGPREAGLALRGSW
jgi:hypothetical protein